MYDEKKKIIRHKKKTAGPNQIKRQRHVILTVTVPLIKSLKFVSGAYIPGPVQ